MLKLDKSQFAEQCYDKHEIGLTGGNIDRSYMSFVVVHKTMFKRAIESRETNALNFPRSTTGTESLIALPTKQDHLEMATAKRLSWGI